MYSIDDVIQFIEIRDRGVIPTLRLLHRYPDMMQKMQCDKGAIKHILTGSDVMAPGLTSAGGRMDDEVEADQLVQITAEGKEHAMQRFGTDGAVAGKSPASTDSGALSDT